MQIVYNVHNKKRGYTREGKRHLTTRWLIREAIGAIGGIGNIPEDCMWVRKRDIHHYLTAKGVKLVHIHSYMRNQEEGGWVILRKQKLETYARLTQKALDYHAKFGVFKQPKEIPDFPHAPAEGKYVFCKNGRIKNTRLKWDLLECLWHLYKKTGEPVSLIEIRNRVRKEREDRFKKEYDGHALRETMLYARKTGLVNIFKKGRFLHYVPTTKLEEYFKKFPPEQKPWFTQ